MKLRLARPLRTGPDRGRAALALPPLAGEDSLPFVKANEETLGGLLVGGIVGLAAAQHGADDGEEPIRDGAECSAV
jgi:hypothetical protein